LCLFSQVYIPVVDEDNLVEDKMNISPKSETPTHVDLDREKTPITQQAHFQPINDHELSQPIIDHGHNENEPITANETDIVDQENDEHTIGDEETSKSDLETSDKENEKENQTETLITTREDTELELLMTEVEVAELDQRLREVLERLQKQREDYQKWESDLSTRRVKAFGRLKALGRCHTRRLEMYEKMKGYIQNGQGLHATDDSQSDKCQEV